MCCFIKGHKNGIASTKLCLLFDRVFKIRHVPSYFFAAIKRLTINAVRRYVQSACKRIFAQMTNFIAYF